MRKFFIMVLLLAIAAATYLGYAHFTGGSIPTFGLPLGGEKAKVRTVLLAFFENLKFKNKSALHSFVDNAASDDDIRQYLTKTFGTGIDMIDLTKILIKDIELDSQKQRARAKVELSGQNLAINKAFEIERVVFLYRVNDRWLIELVS